MHLCVHQACAIQAIGEMKCIMHLSAQTCVCFCVCILVHYTHIYIFLSRCFVSFALLSLAVLLSAMRAPEVAYCKHTKDANGV